MPVLFLMRWLTHRDLETANCLRVAAIFQLTNLKNIFLPFPMWFWWRAALVLPKAEKLLRTSVQPYISSILEALMEPASRGFSEVRDVFFKEMVEISKNTLNGGGKEKLGDVSYYRGETGRYWGCWVTWNCNNQVLATRGQNDSDILSPYQVVKVSSKQRARLSFIWSHVCVLLMNVFPIFTLLLACFVSINCWEKNWLNLPISMSLSVIWCWAGSIQ